MVGKYTAWLPERLLDVAGILLILMMLNITLDVILKAVFNSPIQGTLEVTAYYYMVGAVLLPIAAVELAQASISADVFYNLMPRRTRAVILALILALCAVTYAGLSWITWIDALRAFKRGEFSMGGVSMLIWPSRFILPVSFLLGGLACLWNLGGLLFSSRAREALLAEGTDPLAETETE